MIFFWIINILSTLYPHSNNIIPVHEKIHFHSYSKVQLRGFKYRELIYRISNKKENIYQTTTKGKTKWCGH